MLYCLFMFDFTHYQVFNNFYSQYNQEHFALSKN
ncbi:hypothetical protein EYZ11_012941 [Aspergillus tanneri]|uniref:Uncharacterized protein n=1 Tax=Aspergillus tanneri TaxID=1220188 RepID=A0A4S3IYZ4_9EURO|nr:hypothetical protein EYZ11_012941 [Aspergillus tanneri]